MPSAAITTAAALIEGDACEPIWRIVRAEVARRQRDGGQVRPSVQRALEALRDAAQGHLSQQAMFAREHIPGPVSNITPESVVVALISTDELAGRLHVTPTHARRLAKKAGIEPAARNAWRPTDIDALVVARRTA
jgi:hypothetical protein